MAIDFNWLDYDGVRNVISLAYKILGIIRIIVPIGLIIMTTIDIMKKVIDPNDKDGQKKIMIRAIAALIIFIIPTIINYIFLIIDVDVNNLDINPKNKTQNTPLPVNTPRPTSTPTPIITPKPTPTPVITSTPKITPTPKPTLDSIDIINCPRSTATYLVGDKVNLVSSIPNSFNGEIKWKTDEVNEVKIIESSDKRSATIELIGRPATGSVFITVSAGGKAKTCYINVNSIKDLEITNCPSNNQKFHVGDKFILKSNLPSNYHSTPIWQSATSPNTFKFTPIGDGREVEIEILSVPSTKYAYIGLGADSKSTVCLVNIE